MSSSIPVYPPQVVLEKSWVMSIFFFLLMLELPPLKKTNKHLFPPACNVFKLIPRLISHFVATVRSLIWARVWVKIQGILAFYESIQTETLRSFMCAIYTVTHAVVPIISIYGGNRVLSHRYQCRTPSNGIMILHDKYTAQCKTVDVWILLPYSCCSRHRPTNI